MNDNAPLADPVEDLNDHGKTTIQSLVFPNASTSEALPLYADRDSTAGESPQLPSGTNGTVPAATLDVLDRTSARVVAGSTVSFASYFNAFPASYWHHWTALRSVTLTLTTVGSGTVTVVRSNARGETSVVESCDVSDETTSRFELPLKGFDEGGWYWFDVRADDDIEVSAGAWHTTHAPVTPGLLSIGITTLNKPDYCVRTLETLAASPNVLREIDRIFIVDQGNRKVADEPGFAAVAAALGDQLTVIDQPNLGGSGGFARGMAETLKRPDSTFVMLLDDDVDIEPEGILRAVRFARLCVSPTIVGGHMLDLGDKSVLHAFSEIVDRQPFMWGPPDREHERHDFRQSPLRHTPWLHQREDSDFNGWWMCLIPTSILRDIGLALPAFIKWDDAEYGLRAQAAGYPTVSFPGAALWHISWIDKDDTLDWQAYFHARNRLIAALLHSAEPGGGTLLSEYRKQDLKHLLSMQYYPVALRHQALRDVLAGPGKLHETLPTQLATVREEAAAFPEMHVYRSGDPADPAPETNEGKRVYPPTNGKGPRGRTLLWFSGKAALRHWFSKPAAVNVERPQLEISKRDATWWRLPGFDSALVDTADAGGASWYTRDRARFRSLLRESIRLHRHIARNWDTLRDQYRAAAPQITSVEAWEKTFHHN